MVTSGPRRNKRKSATSFDQDDFGASDEAYIKKGPWTPDEDQVLLEYVDRYGPRDWSSVRSKGLLPRTGKSCRLRYVNKLKPDLKSGCKFSAEEANVVLDLQAELGNKWAKIATYLPGRTDNDVKNFWSTRQKRLARTNSSKGYKNSGKMTTVKQLPHHHHQVESGEISDDQDVFDEKPSRGNQPNQPYFTSSSSRSGDQPSQSYFSSPRGNQLNQPYFSSSRRNQPNQSYCLQSSDHSMAMVKNHDLTNESTHADQHYLGLPLPTPPLDFPLLSENQDFISGLGDPGDKDLFGCHTVSGMSESGFGLWSEFDAEDRAMEQEMHGSIFGDLPPDIFDGVEPTYISPQWPDSSTDD